MSKCLRLCDCNGSGSAAESLPVRVIGCCSEGKHYLRSVEAVKCSRSSTGRVVRAVCALRLTVCVCWLMPLLSDFKLWPFPPKLSFSSTQTVCFTDCGFLIGNWSQSSHPQHVACVTASAACGYIYIIAWKSVLHNVSQAPHCISFLEFQWTFSG